MPLLNQLFNRGLLGAKCKTCLNLAISRIKLVQNKRVVQLSQMRKEIAQLLQSGQEAIARIRVEHVIREQNLWSAYEILELFCEFVHARLPIIDSQRDCPPEVREAVASIMFAAPRCSDLPDLMQVKNLFSAKYGKEFALAISELHPDSSVNRAMIEKLSVSAPSGETKLKQLMEIAQEHSLNWDSSNTEAEFRKKHADLLDGSKRMCSETAISQAVANKCYLQSSATNGAKPGMPRSSDNGTQSVASSCTANNTLLFGHAGEKSLVKINIVEPVSDRPKETRHQSLDILERARAAIASADRAAAAAHSAAQLADINYGSWKVE